MKVYESNKIRNLGIVAHGGAGKTSLTEALVFNTGATKRFGKVDEGNTIADFQPEEIKRKVTISTALVACEWRDHKINILDTPGFADFFGEVKSTLRVADSLLILVDAVAGVEVQTLIISEYADKLKIPRFVFINKMDRENASFERAVQSMKDKLDGNIVPVQLPIGSEANFKGVIDLLSMKALMYDENGNSVAQDIPTELRAEAERYREILIEAAAEGDDEVTMKFLEGEELSKEEIILGLRAGIKLGKVIPVMCGSAIKNIGVNILLDFIIDYLPSFEDITGNSQEELEKEPLAVLVFKTIADPFVGKISLYKVIQGTLKSDATVYNSSKEKDEKYGQLFLLQGKTQIPLSQVKPGDIAAVNKLQYTQTGDTLTTKDKNIILDGIDFPQPSLTVAISPKTKGDEDKLGNAIARCLEEDLTLRIEKNIETKETLLTGMGELHLDINVEKMHRKFNVEVTMKHPRVPYRETIKQKVTHIEGKHKKQSGGHGQFGHIYIDMEPNFEKEFEFTETVFGGSVPRQYWPAVEKGMQEAMNEGYLAGYPVTNIKITLKDGSYHAVDSSEMAFKIAAHHAFKKAMEMAKPVLLEPIVNIDVYVPDQYMGDIIGDLNTKRGRILGMEKSGKMQVVKATAPLSEMYRYAIDLKSITHGRGSFNMEFAQYEEIPAIIADKIVEKAKKEKTE